MNRNEYIASLEELRKELLLIGNIKQGERRYVSFKKRHILRDDRGRFVSTRKTLAEWLDMAISTGGYSKILKEIYVAQLLSGGGATGNYKGKTLKLKEKADEFKSADSFLKELSISRYSGSLFFVSQSKYNLFSSGDSLSAILKGGKVKKQDTQGVMLVSILFNTPLLSYNKGKTNEKIFNRIANLTDSSFRFFVVNYLYNFVEKYKGTITDLDRYKSLPRPKTILQDYDE